MIPVTPRPAHTHHEATKRSKAAARQPGRASKVGWEQAGGGGGKRVFSAQRRQEVETQRGGHREASVSGGHSPAQPGHGCLRRE